MVVHQDYRDVIFNCTEEELALEIAHTLNTAWKLSRLNGIFPLDTIPIANDN